MTTANAGSPVIIQPREFRLPEVLRHIEAGRVVYVVPPPVRCGFCGYLPGSRGHRESCGPGDDPASIRPL